MFSATWPKPIRALSERYQRAPVDVRVEQAAVSLDITETFFEIAPGQQLDALAALLSRHQPDSCIAFCNTKQQCDEVTAALNSLGFSALALHGDLEQKDRDSVLVRFGNKSCSVLVATDVAARGLDIKSLPLVVNVEPARDSEVHTHRIGRTGRAGEQGLAVTFCTPAQSHKINRLESARKTLVKWGNSSELLTTPLEPRFPAMTTLCIAGGRKDKMRPGDVLGALTGEAGLPGSAVGKIDLFDFQCFVAIDKGLAATALKRLESGRIKGRKIRVRYA
jgi:ATP-independent RNA helicase DbpA